MKILNTVKPTNFLEGFIFSWYLWVDKYWLNQLSQNIWKIKKGICQISNINPHRQDHICVLQDISIKNVSKEKFPM